MRTLIQKNSDNTISAVTNSIFRSSLSFHESSENLKKCIHVSSSLDSWHSSHLIDTKSQHINQMTAANMMRGKNHSTSVCDSSYFVSDNTLFTSLADDRVFPGKASIISGPLSVIYNLKELFSTLPERGVLIITTVNSHIFLSLKDKVIKKMLIIPASDDISGIPAVIDLFLENKSLNGLYVTHKAMHDYLSDNMNLKTGLIKFSESFFKYFNTDSSMSPYIETLCASLCVRKNIRTMITSEKSSFRSFKRNIAAALLFSGALIFSGFSYNDLGVKRDEVVLLDKKIETQFKTVLPDTPIVEPVYQLEMYLKRNSQDTQTSVTDSAVSLLSVVSEGIVLNELDITDKVVLSGSFEKSNDLEQFRKKIESTFKCTSSLDWQDTDGHKQFEIVFRPNMTSSVKEL
jgi:hypothetical protein